MSRELIREELARLLDMPIASITDKLQLDEVGWDSIVCVSLIAFLIGEFNCEIELREIESIQTVGDLWNLLESVVAS
ncbi:MAG: acyl carrier protein [Proteobacteria bacterium]|nr:acyl carrier protein [Pseudomonadota bacterium]